MSGKVKSVFRQKVYKKVYKYSEVAIRHSNSYISRGIYEEKGDLINDVVLEECEIDMPYLEIGDGFFLSSIQQHVVIEDKMRSSDGAITYYTKSKLKESENTKDSYELAKDIQVRCDEYNKILKEYSDYKAIYRYHNRFFNFSK